MTNRTFSGWASVEVIDSDNDVVTMDALKAVMEDYMSMGGPIIDLHSNKLIGRTLDYEFKKKPMEDGTEEDGLWLNCEAYDRYEYHDKVWKKIKSGQYEGLSIGAKGKEGGSEVVCNSEECHRSIKKLELFEISVVDEPANPEAKIEEVNMIAKQKSLFSKICPHKKNEPCGTCHIVNKSVGDILKPAVFDRCVAELEDNPDIKEPYAVCQATVGKEHEGNPSPEEATTKTGGTQMTKEEKAEIKKGTPPAEETKKQEDAPDPMEAILARLDALDQRLSEIETKAKDNEEEKPDEEEEEKKKDDEEDEDEREEEKKGGDAALTVAGIQEVVKTELEKAFKDLKAPSSKGNKDRPDLKKTVPEVSGKTGLPVDFAELAKTSNLEIMRKAGM